MSLGATFVRETASAPLEVMLVSLISWSGLCWAGGAFPDESNMLGKRRAITGFVACMQAKAIPKLVSMDDAIETSAASSRYYQNTIGGLTQGLT